MTDTLQTALPALTVGQIVALMNKHALEELAVLGDDFYNARFRSYQALTWYNKMLLTEIAKLPAAASYHEIGGGVGILPMGLGLLGHRTVNIDVDASRVECGRRILARLAAADPQLPTRVQMIAGSLPEAAEGLDTKRAFAITTNISGIVLDEVSAHALIARILEMIRSHYRGYIFDACLLSGHHRDPESWGGVLNLACRVFGKTPVLFFDKGDYSRYYFVEF